ACTLVLSTIPAERICVTSRAVLGFHAPRWVDRQGRVYAATEETRLVAATYPAPVRAWIERQGGLSSRLIYLRGRELAAMYRRGRFRGAMQATRAGGTRAGAVAARRGALCRARARGRRARISHERGGARRRGGSAGGDHAWGDRAQSAHERACAQPPLPPGSG